VRTSAYTPALAHTPPTCGISIRLCFATARRVRASAGTSPCASVVITQRIVAKDAVAVAPPRVSTEPGQSFSTNPSPAPSSTALGR
jgi:hypothetical protein